METTKTTPTWEEFLAAGKPDQRWEYIDGEIRFMSPTGFDHGRTIHRISSALSSLDEREWVCVGADVAFTMANGDRLCPDAAVVRRDRLPVEPLKGPAPFPPDVAFEVISPGDRWSDIQWKRRIYRENGVIQVWVDPQERTVEVMSPRRGTRIFAEGETVVIEELPGFQMNLFPIGPEKSEQS
jgi:Uma2 family endonuclease